MMARSELLIRLDTHLANGGKIHEFDSSSQAEDLTLDEANLMLVIHLGQQLYKNFPGKVNPNGSEIIQQALQRVKPTGFEIESVARSAAALLDFASAGFVTPIFTHENLPAEAGSFAPGWSFLLNLNPEKKTLGDISFEKDFFRTILKERQGRLLSAVFGAGRFLDIIDNNLGDIAHAVDISDKRFIAETINAFPQALAEQLELYSFLQKASAL